MNVGKKIRLEIILVSKCSCPITAGVWSQSGGILRIPRDLTQLKNWVEIWVIERGLDDCHSATTSEILDDEAMMVICLSLFL